MKRTGIFLALFAAGMLVFFLGGYWSGMPGWARGTVKTALPILFLVTTVVCSRVERLYPLRKLSVALLAASSGFMVGWWCAGPIQDALNVTPDSVSGIALLKFIDAVLVVVPVLLVARAGGWGASDLYLGRGRPRIWLPIGILGFAGFFAVFLIQALGQEIPAETLLRFAPWTLLFIAANAIMEELHFRGLLLKCFEELLGPRLANLCIALFFAVVHAPVEYTQDIFIFVAFVFVLALAWGYLIQRSESLWGAVIFHAGADLAIIVGIYTAYGGL